ncbi:MAG: hypothetical protein PVH19_08260 [Planctomycetia bacterium]|jgi:hypothetical protein
MALDIYGTVFKQGTVTCMARVVGDDVTPITAVDISAASCSIWLLDTGDVDSRTAVTGHQNATLTPGDVIFATLQTEDDRWTIDSIGYNFLHTIDVSTDDAFTQAGRDYLVEYRLTPVSGQVILLRFRFHAI